MPRACCCASCVHVSSLRLRSLSFVRVSLRSITTSLGGEYGVLAEHKVCPADPLLACSCSIVVVRPFARCRAHEWLLWRPRFLPASLNSLCAFAHALACHSSARSTTCAPTSRSSTAASPTTWSQRSDPRGEHRFCFFWRRCLAACVALPELGSSSPRMPPPLAALSRWTGCVRCL